MTLPSALGVSYIVVWQMPGMTREAIVPPELHRPDIRVIVSDSRGLSVSRNIAIAASDADISMIADDDTVILPDAFESVRKVFAAAGAPDIALFRIAGKRKKYPASAIRIGRRLPSGYWVTSSEIVFRTASVRGRLEFRPDFGLGADRFTAAEEAFFIADALRTGFSIDVIPVDVCRQPSASSGERSYTPDGGFAASQGAYIRYIHGVLSGLPRLVFFSWRAFTTHKAPFFYTLNHAFQGFICKTT